MTSFLHGQDLVGDEILTNLSAIQALTTFRNNSQLENTYLTKFINQNQHFKTRNNRGLTKQTGLIYHGLQEYELLANIRLCELVFNFDKFVLEAIFSVDRLTFKLKLLIKKIKLVTFIKCFSTFLDKIVNNINEI